MATPPSDLWTFPIHLANPGAPTPEADMELILTATLEKIPGFSAVEKHSGAERGFYLAHFQPGERSRQEIQDAIAASGYTVRQPAPDQDIQLISTPEG